MSLRGRPYCEGFGAVLRDDNCDDDDSCLAQFDISVPLLPSIYIVPCSCSLYVYASHFVVSRSF